MIGQAMAENTPAAAAVTGVGTIFMRRRLPVSWRAGAGEADTPG
jgi:hypothetical protein